jgi:outer membrane protein OmpA-like peptidoglycan-associated protein
MLIPTSHGEGRPQFGAANDQDDCHAAGQVAIRYVDNRGRVAVEGYGDRRPVAPNTNPDGTDNPAGRARNRRVEFLLSRTPAP